MGRPRETIDTPVLAATIGINRPIKGNIGRIIARDDRLGGFARDLRASFPCLDAAVIAVPSAAAVGQSIAIIRDSGQVLLFAHTRKGEPGAVDFASICLEEKDLIGSYSSDFTLQEEVASLVFSRRLDMRKLVTHTFPLEETAAAVALAMNPTEDSLKVVVDQTVTANNGC